MLKSYYDILNIDENASKSEIKKQFRKLVRMYHPDLNSSFLQNNALKKSIKRQTYCSMMKKEKTMTH